jgi:hypothetical protein
MQLHILLPKESPKTAANNLKVFIEKASINGLYSVKVERVQHSQDQMGAGDILNSIQTIIEAASEPLVELVKCLQKYVDNYRTVITIPTRNGNIELKQGRSMKSEEIKDLITSIQKNDA